MGRSSKFIASEVRLRSPSWKAWAFVSIALCPAFAGADRATAGPVTVSVPIPTVNVPKVSVPTAIVPKVNVPTAIVVPKVNGTDGHRPDRPEGQRQRNTGRRSGVLRQILLATTSIAHERGHTRISLATR